MYPASVEYQNRQIINPKLRQWIWEQLYTWGLLSATDLFLIFMLIIV